MDKPPWLSLKTDAVAFIVILYCICVVSRLTKVSVVSWRAGFSALKVNSPGRIIIDGYGVGVTVGCAVGLGCGTVEGIGFGSIVGTPEG